MSWYVDDLAVLEDFFVGSGLVVEGECKSGRSDVGCGGRPS